MTKKPTAPSGGATQKAAAPEPELDGPLRTMTMRMKAAALDQLREMAFHARVSQHSLTREALNDFFRKHGKPPIA